MAKATLHDRLVAALLASGERLVPDAATQRYTVLTCSHPKAPQGWHYYVGRAGALRVGPSASASRAVSETLKDTLLGIARLKQA
ncbi:MULTISPECIES: hypothetical protein [Erythrobacter]|uniref:hypothetical protein n=1 Tax=Erythrobacter TaxID=1041 RepID=UPI00041DDB4E|nr:MULTISPECIES: hypothetical protein [Erythrobacter]